MNGVYLSEEKKKNCPVCKKEFKTILSSWDEWGWRSVGVCFCSYHCMREYEKEYFSKKRYPSATMRSRREPTASERKQIMEMHIAGKSMPKIAELFYMQPHQVRKVIQEEKSKQRA